MRESMPLSKSPVFIIGAGRSGTTLLYKLLCLHADVAWVSNYVNQKPGWPWLSKLNNVSHLCKGLCRRIWFSKTSNAYFVKKNPVNRYFPFPVEGENIYRYCKIPALKNESWKITIDQKTLLIKSFQQILRFQNGNIVVNKRTANNRRIPHLLNVFPDAKFVHIIRDGRAVSRSLVNVKWWNTHKVWWMNKMPAEVWEKKGNAPILLAAQNWIQEVCAIKEGLKSVKPENLLEIRYEDLSLDFDNLMKRILGFLQLGKDERWDHEINQIEIMNRNKSIRHSGALQNEPHMDLVTRMQEDLLKGFRYL